MWIHTTEQSNEFINATDKLCDNEQTFLRITGTYQVDKTVPTALWDARVHSGLHFGNKFFTTKQQKNYHESSSLTFTTSSGVTVWPLVI